MSTRQFWLNGGMRVVSLALGVIASIVVARVLGPEDFGAYAFVFTLLSVSALPAGVALNQLVMRETAHLLESNRLTTLTGFRRRSLQWIGGVSALIVMSIVALDGLTLLLPAGPSLSATVLLLIPLLALSTFFSESLRGAGDLVSSQWPELLLRPIAVLTLLSCLLIFDGSFSIELVLFVQVAALLLTVTCFARRNHVTFSKIGLDIKMTFDDDRWREALPWFFLLTAVWSLTQQIGVLITGLLGGDSTHVSAMQLGLSASMLVALPLVVMTTITGPELARINSDGPSSQALMPAVRATRLATFVSFLILVPLLSFTEILVTLIYGNEFVFAVNTIRVLCLAQFINVAFGLTGQLLISSGFERETVRGQLLGLLVTMIGGLVLVRTYGSLGVASAILMGTLTWNFMLARRVLVHFGIARLLRADVS